MINVFVLQNGRLNQVPIESRADLENVAPIWVDMTDPTEEERSWVKSTYDVTMPDEDDVKDIEASPGITRRKTVTCICERTFGSMTTMRAPHRPLPLLLS